MLPARPKRSAASSPKPDEAPVITTIAPCSSTRTSPGRAPSPSLQWVAMDVIGSHAARLPAIDARWEPGPWERDELLRALVDGGMAGPRVSHPMDNVRDNIRLLCEGDEDKQFGMTGLQTHTPEQVFSLVAAAAGFPDDPHARSGPVPVDARLVLRDGRVVERS